tara:strand:+ start:3132 stop:4061 length:930 start_codon:yes stop_codon:yes gene_type:complete
MNYIDAIFILEIDKNIQLKDLTLDFLKRRYHTLALKNHPDKNGNTSEYTIKFQQIHEAYCFLKADLSMMNHDEIQTDMDDDTYKTPNMYVNMVMMFLKNIFSNDTVSTLLRDLVLGVKKVSEEHFEKFDKNSILEIYTFLSNNRSLLHLSSVMLNEIRDIVLNRFDDISIYKLNPSINDLLQHNIYKLCINDNVFLVPLWHNEVYFDNSGCEIIVICEPELPTNITIDDDNNIHTDILVDSRRLSTIIGNNEDICCTIGDKLIKLPSSDLFLKTDQHYIIKKEGLSKAISDDIYDITDLADIIIRVIIY